MSGHAAQRGAQRNVTREQMLFVVRHGRRAYAKGAVHCVFGRKEQQRLRGAAPRWVERLEGVVVVLDLERQTIMTVYRNRKALKHLRKSASRHRSERYDSGKPPPEMDRIAA